VIVVFLTTDPHGFPKENPDKTGQPDRIFLFQKNGLGKLFLFVSILSIRG